MTTRQHTSLCVTSREMKMSDAKKKNTVKLERWSQNASFIHAKVEMIRVGKPGEIDNGGAVRHWHLEQE